MKRGQRYGTLVCDLEQRRIVDLLHNRESATVEARLKAHPEITLISRDRGGGYGQAATKAAPQTAQVADRWHLMENASAAVLETVRHSMRSIREVLNAAVINPALLTLCRAHSIRRLPAAPGQQPNHQGVGRGRKVACWGLLGGAVSFT